jgi:hypothetical protein
MESMVPMGLDGVLMMGGVVVGEVLVAFYSHTLTLTKPDAFDELSLKDKHVVVD